VPAPSSPTLAELQRWMRWALTHPLGVERALAGKPGPGLPPRFVEPPLRALGAIPGDEAPGRGTSARLSVYASGYFGRLHGALVLEYPRLERAVGAEGFRALVGLHLLSRPSTSASLADLGEALAETLQAHPVVAGRPWLIDLARLERALAEVWMSDGGPFPPLVLPAAGWDTLRLELSPALRLLRLGWDVVETVPELGAPEERETWTAVWRDGEATAVERLAPAPGELLAALGRGATLGEVCELAEVHALRAEEVGAMFSDWAGQGWLRGISRGPRRTSA